MKEVIYAAALSLCAATAWADVTVQQSFALDVAGAIKAHGSGDELTTPDKQRRDNEFHCEGFMSLVCGNSHTGDIVRLDRNLSWDLQPDKKIYLETPFPTPEERAQAAQKLQETMDKIKQCQEKQQAKHPAQNTGDTSDCDLSPPKIDVSQTDEHATIAGHEARKSSVKWSQTCTDRKTGDVCEFVYGFDLWLTSDTPAGASDRQAFGKAYMAAMGLDPAAESVAMKGVVQRFMAPYSSQLSQLTAKAGALKGYPLRTTFRLIIGGPQCNRSKQSAQSSDDSSSSSPPPTSLSGLAGNLGAKAFGGFLSKRNANTDAGSQSAAAANNAAPVPEGYAQVIAFTSETTSITTGSIPAEQFEIPAGWTLEKPKPNKSSEYSCPADDK